ncbi:MAG: SCO family protein [Rhodospirillales bacterium]|nr:SCO family protein [Rhodospirillales bacterium]
MRRPYLYLSLVLVIGALGVAAWLSAPGIQQSPPKPGHAFQLIDHNGKPVTEKDFRGKYLLVFFGYTYCPDVCPTALADMSRALDILGADGSNIQPLFISVDPERDTPSQLKDYVANFHPRLIGLTGDKASIAAAAKSYKALYLKLPDPGGDPDAYLVGHSSAIFLTGPNGEALGSITPGADPDGLASALRKIIKR